MQLTGAFSVSGIVAGRRDERGAECAHSCGEPCKRYSQDADLEGVQGASGVGVAAVQLAREYRHDGRQPLQDLTSTLNSPRWQSEQGFRNLRHGR